MICIINHVNWNIKAEVHAWQGNMVRACMAWHWVNK